MATMEELFGEPVYSVREAAEATRLTYWTVQDMIKRGRIMRTKVGGKVVIRKSELMKLIKDVPYTGRPRRPRKQKMVVEVVNAG